MSRERGGRLQNALAAYVTRWWPRAESAGAGRPGRDVLHTDGVWFEVKTAADGEHRPGQFMRQAVKGASACGDLPVVVWFPPGIADPRKSISMIPTCDLMILMERAGVIPTGEDDEK